VKRGSVVLWRAFDDTVIDGLVNGAGRLVTASSQVLRRLQTGYVQNYALGVLAGAVAIIWWLVGR
jgi:NADH-quinone oxidoreductase subunit L